jgi:hypothetical protein
VSLIGQLSGLSLLRAKVENRRAGLLSYQLVLLLPAATIRLVLLLPAATIRLVLLLPGATIRLVLSLPAATIPIFARDFYFCCCPRIVLLLPAAPSVPAAAAGLGGLDGLSLYASKGILNEIATEIGE